MTPIGLVLPLRIERLEEAIKVVDANGKAAAYFGYPTFEVAEPIAGHQVD